MPILIQQPSSIFYFKIIFPFLYFFVKKLNKLPILVPVLNIKHMTILNKNIYISVYYLLQLDSIPQFLNEIQSNWAVTLVWFGSVFWLKLKLHGLLLYMCMYLVLTVPSFAHTHTYIYIYYKKVKVQYLHQTYNLKDFII